VETLGALDPTVASQGYVRRRQKQISAGLTTVEMAAELPACRVLRAKPHGSPCALLRVGKLPASDALEMRI